MIMSPDFWQMAYVALKDMLLPLLPSLAGSVVSLQFVGRGLSVYHKLSSICAGVTCAVYVAPVLIRWCGADEKELHASLQFLIGLFALAIGREIFREIENGLIQKIRARLLGGTER
jgi:hypothetical protein